MQHNLKDRARLIRKGHCYDDFEEGRVFQHHWGRTINEGDNALFTTLTLNYNPLYFNAPYAAAHGHCKIVVSPLLVFNMVFGLSVEDLSEGGGPFLGVDALEFRETVYVGDTLTASSIVLTRRPSSKTPDFGIVTWSTTGTNQHGQSVIAYQRTNLVRRNPGGSRR